MVFVFTLNTTTTSLSKKGDISLGLHTQSLERADVELAESWLVLRGI